MNRIAFLIIGLLTFASCTEAQPAADVSVSSSISKVVKPEEFKELLKLENRQLVDVRTADEYSGGKIEDAVNIDYFSADFKDRFADFDKEKPLLVYCAAGGRSAKAASVLKEMGFKEIYDLSEGYNGWPYK